MKILIKMRKCFLLLMVISAMLLCSCGKKVVVDAIDIIPEPVFMVQKEGSYVVSNKTKICFQNIGRNNETARHITRSLHKLHIRPSFSPHPVADCIIFHLNDTVNDLIGKEGYVLEVRSDCILIQANTETGLFYGFQTFSQMLPLDASSVHYSRIQLPLCTIQDYPRFPWRGSMLDVSRHMLSVKEIKHHLDLMALYKLNKFYWHLSDDQGWRVEIEKYPQLNDVGSWRPDRPDVPWNQIEPARPNESSNDGGFYSKDEIAEIVQYASRLHIDVIPEFEIPNHCSAILASYPEFACPTDTSHYLVQPGPFEPATSTLCLGNDSVLQFLRDLIDEIIPLFPSPYVHIGGTSICTDHWSRCPKCQARMRQAGLDSIAQLNGWLMSESEKYLELQGKKILVWGDAVGQLSPTSIITAQGDPLLSLHAARLGHCVVASPDSYCNFNYVQGNPTYQPAGPAGYLTLHKVYLFDPMPQELAEPLRPLVLGAQCLLWTGFVNNYHQASYMLLPRLFAFSESVWSPSDKKDWSRFRHKVTIHKQRLALLGYDCCPGSFMPMVSATDNHDGTYTVSIDFEVEGSRIYYCVGNAPTQESRILYTAPFTVPSGSVVKAITYFNGKAMEEVYTFPIGQS